MCRDQVEQAPSHSNAFQRILTRILTLALPAAGPTMMFVDLLPNSGPSGVNHESNDRTWLETDLNIIATQWKDLLKTAGFDASLYSIEGDRLLVSIAKGWHGSSVKNFFLTRSEVRSVTWNSIETLAKEYTEEF